jgi:putative ABC transport system ATP-binding protein
MIFLEAVTKHYPDGNGSPVTALRDVSLFIEQGEFVSIVGPSGSGKTTLLLTMAGLIAPTTGHVLLDERPIYEIPVAERAALRLRTVGFLFQTFNLVPYLTALENVQVPMCLARRGDVEQRDRAEALLERFGLHHRLNHKPAELSVGERQRVALARSLANDPKLLLADEPTGNLDPALSTHIFHHLRVLNDQGITVVVVTHDHEAASSAPRQIDIQDGAIIGNFLQETRSCA